MEAIPTPVSDNAASPSYSEEYLSGLETAALFDLMRGDEDRVPRGVIDECMRRGDAMVATLEDIAERPWVDDRAPGDWWLRLHAVMILGLIGSAPAGLLLVRFMRRMSEADDANLQDWLAGYWPALFANKPDAVLPALREVCGDRTLDWYIRANAVDPVVAAAERCGRQALDEALDWVASIAAAEEEDWDVRLSCGNVLLDFSRERHRALVDGLEKRQTGIGKSFSAEDIERAYSARDDDPDWRVRDDPWAFYQPEAIVARQARWAEEDTEGSDDEFEAGDLPFDEPALPYIRPMPKAGRNDPCPCGSGKKYKKCCLLTEQRKAG